MITRRRYGAAVTVAAILCGLAAGCGREPAGSGGGAPKNATLGNGIVAQVGEARLSDADLSRLIPPEIREGITGAEIRDIVDRWVQTELLYQKAVQDGLEKDGDVAVRLRDLRRDLLADEILQRELRTRVRVGSEEIQAYYQKHRAEYTQEARLAHILVNTRDEAENVLAQLRAGIGFESLAQQLSLDTSAGRGGDLGFQSKDEMNPAFRALAFELDPGETAGPVLSSQGFHVLKLVARRPAAESVPFEAVRDEIMHTLLLEKQQRAQGEILETLRSRNGVQVATTYAGLALEKAAAPSVPLPAVSRVAPAADTTAHAGQD